ncbi:MAG: spermidine synthase [Gammaproteobacteria bacterium]
MLAPVLARVDTVEIERAVVEAVQILRPRVERVFADSRSRIHIEDARTFFSLRGGRYDMIVSEPSNPWVSGVAMLFTQEFYGQMTQFLNRGGLLVQWLQLYEIDEELVWSILKAFAAHFPHYRLYRTDSANVLIVGSRSEIRAASFNSLFGNATLAAALERVGVRGAEDVNARMIGDEITIKPLLNRHAIHANSDYRPVLDQQAVKARFLRRNAAALLNLHK